MIKKYYICAALMPLMIGVQNVSSMENNGNEERRDRVFNRASALFPRGDRESSQQDCNRNNQTEINSLMYQSQNASIPSQPQNALPEPPYTVQYPSRSPIARSTVSSISQQPQRPIQEQRNLAVSSNSPTHYTENINESGNGIYIDAKELHLQGQPLSNTLITKEKIECKDFDLSTSQEGASFVWPEYYLSNKVDDSIRGYNFESCIPILGSGRPVPDIAAINLITTKLSDLASAERIHPACVQRMTDFNYLALLAHNCTTLPRNISQLPDLDILYYKMVGGVQHLFLRTSSKLAALNEEFKEGKRTNNVYAQRANILINANRAALDHVGILGSNVELKIKQELLNRASRLQASEVLYIEAPRQRHETVINKWVRESGGGSNYVHAEGVQSVDECQLIAPIVVQKGDYVENVGISVDAWCFEDQGVRTVNRPAKITLYNHSHAEKRGWFSKSTADMQRWDDVLVPTRYKVNYYKSLGQDGKETSVDFGYTLIDAGSEIIILKNDKNDTPIEERHVVEIHESSSGFSIFGLGKAGVPDPIGQLQAMHRAYQNGNMIGLTTSTISAVAKTIRAYEDLKDIKNGIESLGSLNLVGMLQIMSKFIQGPSLQFGSRSIDSRFEDIKTHGNWMRAKRMIFHNSKRSTFGGVYEASEDIDIKTRTFITFALPHTIHSKVSMHQSGINVDLLSFALACLNSQVAGVTAALLGSASVSVSAQDTESHCVHNIPTTIRAGKNLRIEAENGYLTQAQIKAAIVHAVFTNDLVLKTLANEKWMTQEGYSVSFSGLANLMKDGVGAILGTMTPSITDAGNFEKIIDDFASMVGTDSFYLKVGNILRTESAFLGHKDHDPNREHIEAKEWQNIAVEQMHKSWDNSFTLPIADVMYLKNYFGATAYDEAIKKGYTEEEAQEFAAEEQQKVDEEVADIDSTKEKLNQIDKETNENINRKVKPVPKNASKADKARIQKENEEVIADEMKKGAAKQKQVILQNITKVWRKETAKQENYSSSTKTDSNDAALSAKSQPSSDGSGSHLKLLDPNKIDWSKVKDQEILYTDVDWSKIRTGEQADKIPIEKIRVPLMFNNKFVQTQTDEFYRVSTLGMVYRYNNRPPRGWEVVDAVQDSIVDGLLGLWDMAKNTYDDPIGMVKKAGDWVVSRVRARAGDDVEAMLRDRGAPLLLPF